MTHDHLALLPYGWSAERIDQLPPRSVPARVLRHDRSSLLAVTGAGTRLLHVPAGLPEPSPTVGDWVAIADPHPDAGAVPIRAVLPRASLLRRLAADGVGEQALAANVDLVLITCGVDRPIRAGRVARTAAQAWDCGAAPVLVLTKAADPDALDVAALERAHVGIPVVVTGALESVGLDGLRALVAGRTAVLVGESGAGKSTLTNALLGEAVTPTADVRAGDHKGRHTTTARHLHLLPGPGGGVLIDTPGIRSVGLAADLDAVQAVFADVAELALECRFSDCAHHGEPGCAVTAAVAEGRLAAERLEGWRRLEREAASAALRASPREYRAASRRFGRKAKATLAQKRR